MTETALPQGWELESIEPSSVTSGEQTATITVSNTSVMVSPTPTPTASPSATVSPTTPPTTAVPSAPPGFDGDLAQTGAQLWAILAALLVLTAGGVLVFTSRRHQH